MPTNEQVEGAPEAPEGTRAATIEELDALRAELQAQLSASRKATAPLLYKLSWMPRFVELVAEHGALVRAFKALRKELSEPAYSTMHQCLRRCEQFRTEVSAAQRHWEARAVKEQREQRAAKKQAQPLEVWW